ncbi:hypothetical protein DPX16_9254 [Anabarilius grahami]|uniref:Uncharacterized protein n=1 Tax=Anabarilius grahami TaxID=495550 RepID=A0A3N0Y644_ANAGA|nr:hypothetical protein DPX16_9254 [Anabarilius grahami]
MLASAPFAVDIRPRYEASSAGEIYPTVKVVLRHEKAQKAAASVSSLQSYDLMSYGESPAYIVTCPAHFGGKIRALFAYRLRGRAAPSLVQRLVYE